MDCFHLTSLILPFFASNQRNIFGYFEEGMSASKAFHHHETPLMKDPVTLMLLADRRMCPSLSDVNTLYDKWLVEKKGPSNGCAMFDCLEEIVADYTTTTMQIIKGGKCYLQRVNRNGPDKQDLIKSYPYAPL